MLHGEATACGVVSDLLLYLLAALCFYLILPVHLQHVKGRLDVQKLSVDLWQRLFQVLLLVVVSVLCASCGTRSFVFELHSMRSCLMPAAFIGYDSLGYVQSHDQATDMRVVGFYASWVLVPCQPDIQGLLW